MPFLIRFLIFSGIALGLGLGSAWRATDKGFFATTHTYGPWVVWFREGTTDADPYTLAHLSRLGTLPMTATGYLTFTAKRDSSGSRLSGDCTYEIRGRSFSALWWDLAAFTRSGQPIQSKAGRSSFTNSTILTAPDGWFVVRLSPEVQPGNWLPAPSGERVVLRLNILRPRNPGELLQSGADLLPDIALVECL